MQCKSDIVDLSFARFDTWDNSLYLNILVMQVSFYGRIGWNIYSKIQYLGYLRVIERKSSQVERALRHSPQNEDLIEMLDLQKSLVYMSSSLRSNQIVLENSNPHP